MSQVKPVGLLTRLRPGTKTKATSASAEQVHSRWTRDQSDSYHKRLPDSGTGKLNPTRIKPAARRFPGLAN